MDTNKLAQNRAEEFGNDVWGKYVIPPFYKQLDLADTKKPRIIIGGRGCGKTMLLRYLCFDSVFSNKKSSIKTEDFENIGLYWKINTQVSGLLKARNIDNSIWISALEHYSVLILSLELIRFLKSINGRLLGTNKILLAEINLKFASDYLACEVENLEELEKHLKSQLRKFNQWIKNVQTIDAPIFLSKPFIEEFILQLKNDDILFTSSNFFIYIDEFENLEPFQKPLINTWLKHSSYPLIFNIAMKKGIDSRDTLGEEKIVNIHDFRIYDIEDFLSDHEVFKFFAAEILFLREIVGQNTDLSKNYKQALVDPERLHERTSKEYQKILIEYVDLLFPSMTYKEIATNILSDLSLSKKFHETLNDISPKDKTKFKDIIDKNFPEATLVTPFILKRVKNNPADVLAEYLKLTKGVKSKFNYPTDWVKNNLVASILYIYESSQKVCPIFAGFDTFCRLSHGNIRYLLELCNKSQAKLTESASAKNEDELVKCQSIAAKNASYSFLNEVRSLGKKGNALYLFAYRLGLIFKLAGKNPLLSEPEINHFSIKDYRETSNEDIDNFLIEAVKWSVLYKTKSTKMKNSDSIEDWDYVLNPIYSPFFNISFRKIRKMEIDKNQFLLLIKGEESEFKFLLKTYMNKWNLNKNDINPSLFDSI